MDITLNFNDNDTMDLDNNVMITTGTNTIKGADSRNNMNRNNQFTAYMFLFNITMGINTIKAAMGILKDMHDTFTAELETETQNEAMHQKNFKNEMSGKADELAKSTEVLRKMRPIRQRATSSSSDTMQELGGHHLADEG